MAVLVIGAAGYIGSHVSAKLANSGTSVVGLASRRPPGIDFTRFHLGRTELIGQLIAALEGCSSVIFVGGTSRPGAPMSSISAELEREAGHVLDLAEICAAHGVQRFVFVSSGGTIYGPCDADPIPETHPTRPINSYGLSKLVAEQGLRLVSLRTGMVTISLRVANPYGPGQMVKGNQGMVAALIAAVKDRSLLQVWGDGEIVRDYVFIDDVTDAFQAALDPRVPSGEYNIGSGVGTSINALIAIVERHAGSIARTYLSGRSIDVPRVVLDIAKARDVLRWSAQTSIDTGIRKTIEAEGLMSQENVEVSTLRRAVR